MCIIPAGAGCTAKQPDEAMQRLTNRYNDSFTYIGYYEDFPRADYVYQFKSSKYPGYPIEVGFNKDPYSWLPSYEVTDNYQAIRFESDMISLVDGAAQKVFINEKYRLGEYEYILTDYPVCATLDEYMKHASAILSLVVYYDLNAGGSYTADDFRQMLEDEIPDGSGHIWVYVYFETNDPNPDKMSYDQMRDFVIYEKYDKMVVLNR
jgi:hypothetical protein